jgi:hypothetical protein
LSNIQQMKLLIASLIFAMLTVAAYGQSKLPNCKTTDVSTWTNCFGIWNATNGNKYVGEWKNGNFHGVGTYTYADGNKYVGDFKDNKLDGQGVFYYLADNQFKGDRYVGSFREGMRSGQGTYYYLANNAFKGDKYSGEFKDDTPNGLGTTTKADGGKYTGEFKEWLWHGKGIYISKDGYFKEGIWDKNNFIRDTKVYLPGMDSYAGMNATRSEIERERQKLAEERRRLEEEKIRIEQAKQASKLTLIATATQPDLNGVVTISIQTNADTSSMKINGDELGGKTDGRYVIKRVARVSQETKFILEATDIYGNVESKTLSVFRKVPDTRATLGQLNVANIKPQPVKDAVAIVIGIEKYKRISKADYANADALDFYDYANRALGIKQENIKLLVDDGADDLEILQAFQNWLPIKVKKNKTEVYVFFSGHGYPGEEGKGLYFLPHGVDKDYMERTAVKQKELIAALEAVQPKAVTMFIDSCYSGQTRAGEILLAGSKPIALKKAEMTYPPEFTVITASNMDQISWSSNDLKHGIFSYYLMKGMEGDADMNKDGKITAAEMHDYLSDMVSRQAMGMNRKQQPQLYGDADRVLVGK